MNGTCDTVYSCSIHHSQGQEKSMLPCERLMATTIERPHQFLRQPDEPLLALDWTDRLNRYGENFARANGEA
jgi:hypothetical protein